MSNKNLRHVSQNFADLGLNTLLLKTLEKSGYSTPTPIQKEMIPHLLGERDVVGQAQTGTGKTAAFALPLLQKLKIDKHTKPQVLVLAPTRELAIQVSDSFKKYGENIKQLKVLPIYGGQEYSVQLQQLKRGVHIVVGTPGRIMDHIRRGSLKVDSIDSFVLDEADEMLKMGFLEDVEWILQQSSAVKQIALFSATMPNSIRRIAQNYLNDSVEITVKGKTVTASKIEQKYIITNGQKAKHQALERILEAMDFDGMLIFVRTKIQTVEIAEQLNSLGYNCGPLNGDIPQNQRLRMIDQLKSGKLDLVVATDVAARGLDVERISHVINYDVPYDTEAYIHRIGRTGRAGREGHALLFLHPREKKLLKSIERQTGGKISLMTLPSIAEINERRIENFKAKLTMNLSGDTAFFKKLIGSYCQENDISEIQVAAALVKMLNQKSPLLLQESNNKSKQKRKKRSEETSSTQIKKTRKKNSGKSPEPGMDRYRLEVGESHGVQPSNIVGAIANEADIDSQYIGRISIFNKYSTVDLPYGMPGHILKHLQKARVCNRMMLLRREALSLPQNETENGSKRKRSKHKSAKKTHNNSSRKRSPGNITH